jgi:UDP-N-acetylglucosamine acyltransferase
VIIRGPTKIGRDNHIYQFSSLGEVPQDKKFHGETSRLEIGDNNEIREYCTMNRGTDSGGGVTRIGNDNWIMAYTHFAHDCIVGNHTVFANGASLAGHATVDDYAILGGFSGVHQFCAVGAYSFIAAGSIVFKDVPPYIIAAGNSADANGLNREGLKRHGFSSETITTLKQAYKIVFRQKMTLKKAIEALQPLAENCKEVSHFIDFLNKSTRGIVR